MGEYTADAIGTYMTCDRKNIYDLSNICCDQPMRLYKLIMGKKCLVCEVCDERKVE